MNLINTFATTAMIVSTIGTAEAQTKNDGTEITAVLDTIERMTDAFAAGDIAGVLSTYEAGATVVAEPGSPVTGEAALREMFEMFIDQGVAFTYGAHDVVLSGDLALHLMKWTAPGPEGDMVALSVAVLRKQNDGSWKMVIDHPFGDTVMQAALAQ